MSLYAEWRNLCDNHANNDEEIKFWENYLKSEAGIYNEILNNKTDVVEGTVAKFKLKILDIENGIDMIGETPSPDFVFNVMPIERTTSPIE